MLHARFVTRISTASKLVPLFLAFPVAQDLPNFHAVVEGQIYRGGQPTPDGIKQLHQMGIKTIIDLRFEAPRVIYQERKLSLSLGMGWIAMPMTPVTDPYDKEMDYLENALLNDPSLRPVFVHCLRGEDRTGLVFGIYRALQQTPRWTPSAAFAEMLQYGFHKNYTQLTKYFTEKTGWTPPLDNVAR